MNLNIFNDARCEQTSKLDAIESRGQNLTIEAIGARAVESRRAHTKKKKFHLSWGFDYFCIHCFCSCNSV